VTTKYIFDTNIFITLQQRQPIDVYPSLWERIGELMDEGMVFSSQEVLEEILVGDDALSQWVKPRFSVFLPTSEIVQEKARDILKQYRGLVEGGKKKNNADPFVIALAQLEGFVVVTEEGHSNSEKAPKIPNVCDGLDIQCINFVTFSREQKFTF
jgi:hypothetical protein